MPWCSGPRVGHTIDTVGGRGLLADLERGAGCRLGAAVLRHRTGLLIAAWILLGIGMGLGLYEAAFATLTRIYGPAARPPITGITLIAGFASTVGWPHDRVARGRIRLAHRLPGAGPRSILCSALPLNLSLPRASVEAEVADEPRATARRDSKSFAMIAVAYVFAATGFVSSGLSALLPTMLVQFGATTTAALFAGMLVGPAQVAARIVEAGWLARYHPLLAARWRTLSNPLGVVVLWTADRRSRRCSPCSTAPATASSPSRAERCRWRCSARRDSDGAWACSQCPRAPPVRWRRWPSADGRKLRYRRAVVQRAGLAVGLRHAAVLAPGGEGMSATTERSRRKPALHLGDRDRTGAGADRRVQRCPHCSGLHRRVGPVEDRSRMAGRIFYAAYVVAVPVLVSLTDRVPTRASMLSGPALTAMSHLGFGFVADGFWTRPSCARWPGSAGPAPTCRG